MDSLVQAPLRRKIRYAIAEMRIRIARVQLNGALELPLRDWPVEFVQRFHVSKRSVGRSERVVQSERFFGSLPGFGHRLIGRQRAEETEPAIRIRDTRVGRRILRIFLDGRFEIMDGLFGALRSPAAPMV